MPMDYPNLNAAVSIGPPKCKHCGRDASSIPNGPAHWCEGSAKERREREVAAAAALLKGCGYRVVAPTLLLSAAAAAAVQACCDRLGRKLEDVARDVARRNGQTTVLEDDVLEALPIAVASFLGDHAPGADEREADSSRPYPDSSR